jgi:hypothetical protein
MLISYRGVVDEGRVRLREAVTLPEGAEVIDCNGVVQR